MRGKGSNRNRRSGWQLSTQESEIRAADYHRRVGRICHETSQGRLHLLVYSRAVLFQELDTVTSGPNGGQEVKRTWWTLSGLPKYAQLCPECTAAMPLRPVRAAVRTRPARSTVPVWDGRRLCSERHQPVVMSNGTPTRTPPVRGRGDGVGQRRHYLGRTKVVLFLLAAAALTLVISWHLFLPETTRSLPTGLSECDVSENCQA